MSISIIKWVGLIFARIAATAAIVVPCMCLAGGAISASSSDQVRVATAAATAGTVGAAVQTSAPAAAPSATPSAPAATPSSGATAGAGGSAATMCGDTASQQAAAAGKVDTFASRASLQARSKLVFAHYLPNLQISLDNKPAASDYYTKNYLNPNGEGGAHAAYGGLIRDRPLPRTPVAASDWRLVNLKTEMRQAKRCGINGFSVDIMQTSGAEHWDVLKSMLTAAEQVGDFTIMLMPDMSVLPDQGPDQLAARLATVAGSKGAYHLPDGRVVISPFMGEARSAQWWTQFNSAMASRGSQVALVPVLVNNLYAWKALAPISYGFSNWGMRNPTANTLSRATELTPLRYAASVRAAGKIWMQPVSVQDERPRQGSYEEAANTANLRKSWAIAIRSKADWVQLTTWNDYGEGSQFAPSLKHGWTNLTISQYYLKWYRTGKAPVVNGDELFLTHRTQPYAARQTSPQSVLMQIRQAGTAPRNTVEALTFLSRPGVVSITVGGQEHTCSVSAGPDTCTVPLATGTVSASVSRDGTVLSRARSPFTVTAQPSVQDLQYVAITGQPPAS